MGVASLESLSPAAAENRMPRASNAASTEAQLGPAANASTTGQGFKRVYQACESCRQKKHKCSLGDPANPMQPCSACRRANILCGNHKTRSCCINVLTPQSSLRRSAKVDHPSELGILNLTSLLVHRLQTTTLRGSLLLLTNMDRLPGRLS